MKKKLILIVGVVVIILGVFIYQSSNTDPQKTTGLDSEYFLIPELGIKFVPADDLYDLSYTITEFPDGKSAGVTSERIVQKAKELGGGDCSDALGAISNKNIDGERVEGGIHIRPHDACSGVTEVQELQRKLLESFAESFEATSSEI